MSIFDLYSKRQKKIRGEVPDVYSYDSIPDSLKVQIIHIWADALGNTNDYFYHDGPKQAYKFVVTTLCREYGVFSLQDSKEYSNRHYLDELIKFILREKDCEKFLDVVELSFRVIDNFTRKFNYLYRQGASEIADNAIKELNARFQEHGVGYRYEEGLMVRIDSELLHAEVIKPSLSLLRSPEFAGAQAEFLKAHEHYRHGNSKEALAECLKSLESTMKSICSKRKWPYDPKATSSKLIQVIFENGLVPTFWNQHFGSLRATLESGVPTARNRLGGHGQGTDVVEVPMHLVAYVLHQTASAIVFLVEADKALP